MYVLGRVCHFVIDARSCEDIISAEAVQKLNIQTENHPKPYNLVRLKKGGVVSVSRRVLSFYLKYKDIVWCNVIAMDVYH